MLRKGLVCRFAKIYLLQQEYGIITIGEYCSSVEVHSHFETVNILLTCLKECYHVLPRGKLLSVPFQVFHVALSQTISTFSGTMLLIFPQKIGTYFRHKYECLMETHIFRPLEVCSSPFRLTGASLRLPLKELY